MPPKEYRIPLSDQAFVHVYFFTEGKPVKEFVVKLILKHGGNEYEVIRFDAAHGGPHRDTLLPDGTKYAIKKFDYLDNNQGLTFALDDIQEHWEFYIERFRQWLEENGTPL
jgi:hypothetical protein